MPYPDAKYPCSPGPWVCDSEKDMFDTDERTWIVTSADGLFLADGIPWEREADARLVAAAPDLLAAVKAIVACAHINTPWAGKAYCISEGRMNAAIAAIAKAEGRE